MQPQCLEAGSDQAQLGTGPFAKEVVDLATVGIRKACYLVERLHGVRRELHRSKALSAIDLFVSECSAAGLELDAVVLTAAVVVQAGGRDESQLRRPANRTTGDRGSDDANATVVSTLDVLHNLPAHH